MMLLLDIYLGGGIGIEKEKEMDPAVGNLEMNLEAALPNLNIWTAMVEAEEEEGGEVEE